MTLAADAARTKQRKRPDASPAASLLAWYDRHRRDLPWRAKPGEAADPYHVWLSEIMLQQTTVRAAAPYYLRFLARWPSVHDLAAAPLEEVLRSWAGLGYYARARNLHACAHAVVERHGGAFPRAAADLAALPGIGPYTAAAVAAIAFNEPEAPVDGNIERVITRLYAIEEELPGAKAVVRELTRALLPSDRPGDFAQALMDLGATICTPQSPACALCPFLSECAARKRGDQESFPRKAAKRAGKLRRGAVFVVVSKGDRVLVRSRPAKGLLGGMTEFPGSDWTHDFDESDALSAAPLDGLEWVRRPGAVTHIFTHFPLTLTVYVARLTCECSAPSGARWVPRSELDQEALPNLMRKVAVHAFGDEPQKNPISSHSPGAIG